MVGLHNDVMSTLRYGHFAVLLKLGLNFDNFEEKLKTMGPGKGCQIVFGEYRFVSSQNLLRSV